MDAAERLAPREAEQMLSWTKICELYPNEWVCLLDVEKGADGSIRCGSVISHYASMKQMLAQLSPSQSNAVLVHTSGRPLRFPRIEMTDEIRDIVRPRR
jgi:hypothetical protein